MAFLDSVCGMTVDELNATRVTFEGVESGFCCQMCCLAFIGNPERYLSPPSRPNGAGDGRGGGRDRL